MSKLTDVEALMRRGPVIPVVVADDERDAVPLARALVAGGLPVVEVTLRTPAAPAAVRRIRAEVPEAVVGAGTVTDQASLDEAVAAGAQFLVSPGSTPRLLDAMAGSGLPFLPAAVTGSEVMGLLERGIRCAKFFPARPAGGTAYLRSLAGPFPDVLFCPTGGIDAAGAPDYLALANVACVGGSWMAPREAVADGRWDVVEALAKEAAALRVT